MGRVLKQAPITKQLPLCSFAWQGGLNAKTTHIIQSGIDKKKQKQMGLCAQHMHVLQ